MAWISKSTPKDDAEDASQFLSRLGYVVLALGVPAGLVLHSLAIFILFPIGVALIVFAALLDPPGHFVERLTNALSSPIVLIGLAGLAWATLSILWTPFTVPAGQHVLKILGWSVAVALALNATREHARATDLYLFPFGLVLAMIAIFFAFIASRQGVAVQPERIADGETIITVLLFPAMGGLAARARNGWARVMLILAFVYAFAIGSTPTMIALFAGFAALSFAVSDLKRTARDLSWAAAGLVILAPLIVLIAAPLARVLMHSKLPDLPAPYPSLALAFHLVTQDSLRLITGHGFEALARGVRAGILPPQTPRSALFEIWYELGVVGALLASAGLWFGFRAIGEAPPRLAPYLAAGLACNLTLASLSVDLSDLTWFTGVGIALIAADVAARSQYRTTRPSAESLAHF